MTAGPAPRLHRPAGRPLWPRLVLLSSVSMAGLQAAVPGQALADGCTMSGTTKNCQIDGGGTYDQPAAVTNDGTSGTHDSPNGTKAGDLNFTNTNAIFNVNSTEAGSTGGSALMDAESRGGNGDDSGDAGDAGAVVLSDKGLGMTLDVNGASNLQAFLKALSLGGSGDGNSNDDNDSDGGNGGAGGAAKITTSTSTRYTLTGTITKAFYGLFVQSVGGTGGEQNDSVVGDQLGGRGGDASTAEIDNQAGITYGSSSSRVQASSSVEALKAESIAGSGGFNNGDAGNASTVTINNSGLEEIALYLNMQASGQSVYGLHGYSLGGAGNASSDNSDRGGNGGNGGDVTITNSIEVKLDITGQATGAGIAAISEGGKGGKGPDKDQPGGNGGNAGNISVTSSDPHIITSGDNVFGILAESLGGQGGDGSDSTAVAGTGGGGGFGGNAGSVTVTTDGRIETSGAYASAIAAMSLGGGGGTGSDFSSILGGAAGNGGNGGNAGLVTVHNDAELDTTGDHSYGILAQSTAGSGGAGGVANGFIVELGGDGAAGGTTGNIDIDNHGEINTAGYGSIGILGQSIGGGGGAAGSAGGVIAVGGNAPVSFQADGGTVTVDNTQHITTTGDAAIGILAQSIGGGGGSATGATGIIGVGGQGSAGGNGGGVTTLQIGTITTSGDYAFGFLAQSVGGGGGDGGNVSDFSVGASTGVGGSAAGGGNGGTVLVDNTSSGTHGTIKTAGYHATGLFAQSVGGGGGTGGDAESVGVSVVTAQVGGHGGGGGTGGGVTIDQNTLSVTTTANEAIGVKAQSVGGGGGDGGGVFAADLSVGVSLGIAVGGSGGVGGDGGHVGVTLNDSTITTGTSAAPTDNSTAVFAQSVGGGGGTGGQSTLENLILGVPVDEDANTFSVSLEMGAGGAGGAAGNGKAVSVGVTDTALTTSGQYSMGIHAQSVGGGGGSGGDSSVYSLAVNSPTGSLNFQAAASVGGLCTAANCGGGNGDDVSVDVASSGTSTPSISRIVTAGDYANGILAQSVGGGGGNAGAGNVSIYSVLATVNAGVAIGVGSKGGVGGKGGTVEVTLGANSQVQTGGSGARGIIAQSVGGGGGTAQGLSLYGTAAAGQDGLPAVPSLTGMINIGMTGGSGGNGDAVTVTNDGTITTAGRDSDGIVAQSVGGGGGMGGSLGGDSGWTLNNVSNAIKQLKDTYDRFSFSMSGEFDVSVGGTGGTGGTGAKVSVTHDGSISTGGDYADGIIAQSIGGGGGMGGSSDVAGYRSQISANIAVGGSGGTGGAGGEVDVTLGDASTITTKGYMAYGVLAQSIGGGGGMGGDGSVVSQATLNIGSGTGGGGGSGNDGGTINFHTTGSAAVTTSGDNAHGIILQSVGNGGGTGAVGDTETGGLIGHASLELAIGGRGGNAGNGGDINVCTGAVTCFTPIAITTNGDRAVGFLAQSIGGGGGTGGAGDPGSTEGLGYSLALDIGGSGGDGGNGGTVTIGGYAFGIVTHGDLSAGILAQSIGGGGGFGAAGYNVDSTFDGDRTLSVNVGGSGGNGGEGHAVDVTVNNSVVTQGDWAHGVIAQSIGGGGGVAGTSMSTIISGDQVGDVIDSKVIVGGAASGGQAIGDSLNPVAGQEAVDLNIYNNVSTQGRWAMGGIAQSIGGGGGIGNGSLQADGQGTATASVAVGGGTGSKGNGGDVGVHFGSSTDNENATSGAGAYGILAQSIGGGGGLGTALTAAFNSTLTVGGAGTGNGGTVEIAGSRTIVTTGADAHAVVLQSIGGGGGVGAFSEDGGTAQYSVQVGGADGANGNGGTVKSTATLQILTTGQRAFGLVAQSIGGGGGIAAAGPAAEIHSPDDCCSSSLTIGGQDGANGRGGAVDLAIGGGSSITTQGNGSHAVVAQSIGGGGGIGGDASGGVLAAEPDRAQRGRRRQRRRRRHGGGHGRRQHRHQRRERLRHPGPVDRRRGAASAATQSGAFAGNTDVLRNGSGSTVTVTQSGADQHDRREFGRHLRAEPGDGGRRRWSR
jgi:hypothetical protein